jgi:hypothetical protein
MRPIILICSCALLLVMTPARAELHVFFISNNPDGYGVDRCLARGETCGAAAAKAYCQARDYAEAISFHRVDRNEATSAVPLSSSACRGDDCEEYVAIECTR